MGDVALTVPVIRSFLEANPDSELTMITRPFFAPFFYGIDRLKLVYPDLKGKHKGFLGIIKFARELRKLDKFDAFIDLHYVLRTQIISVYFKLNAIPVYCLDKGRKEKKRFIRGQLTHELKHTVERYKEAFVRAGFDDFIPTSRAIESSESDLQKAEQFISGLKGRKTIGIAPFAMHRSKFWGMDKIEQLLNLLEKESIHVLLFGGGKSEIAQLEILEKNHSNAHHLAGKHSLSLELALIKKLDLMLSMDSSNMHLAALSGTNTISIWGGTHPHLGFKAYGQNDENCIQIPREELTCRPCSVYGKKPCSRKDILYKCMENISAGEVFQKILSNL